MGMYRASVLLGSAEAVILIVGAPLDSLLDLSAAMRPEEFDLLMIQIDDPSVVAVGRGLDQRLPSRHESLPDREACGVEIDIDPAQAEDLGHRGEPTARFEPGSAHGFWLRHSSTGAGNGARRRGET
jgi:hypothetical protein